jgi:hypothetical protein
MKGMIMMIAAGGAVRESRDNLLTNEARSDAGKWLGNHPLALGNEK